MIRNVFLHCMSCASKAKINKQMMTASGKSSAISVDNSESYLVEITADVTT